MLLALAVILTVLALAGVIAYALHRRARSRAAVAAMPRRLDAARNLETARADWTQATRRASLSLQIEATPIPKGFGDQHVVRARLAAALAEVTAAQAADQSTGATTVVGPQS